MTPLACPRRETYSSRPEAEKTDAAHNVVPESTATSKSGDHCNEMVLLITYQATHFELPANGGSLSPHFLYYILISRSRAYSHRMSALALIFLFDSPGS